MRAALITFFITLGYTLSNLQVLQAQIKNIDAQVTYRFDEQITYSITLTSQENLEMGILFFQAEGDTHTEVGLMQKQWMQEEGRYKLSYTHIVERYHLPPFTWVEYWLELHFQGGEVIKSEVYRFYYSDNRFNWRSLEEGPFRVYWYEGDVQLAQSALDVAQDGLVRIQNTLPIPFAGYVEIYLYAQPGPMLEALGEAGMDWIAGHAMPRKNVVLISIPQGPERQLWLSQRIPHELMHLAVAQYAGEKYENLPIWLREGLASQAELYHNPDYEIVLHHAKEQEEFIPMLALCDAFPREASSALLAYAQSDAFTRFLVQNYGQQKLIELIDMYLDGVDCERALENVYGSSVLSLERHWRMVGLQENLVMQGLFNLIPWFVLLMAVLVVPIGVSLNRLRMMRR